MKEQRDVDTMDRCKKNKFLALLRDGSLSSWLEAEWEKSNKLNNATEIKSGVDAKLVPCRSPSSRAAGDQEMVFWGASPGCSLH